MVMPVFHDQNFEVWSVIKPPSQQASMMFGTMDSLGFLVSYDTSIFSLTLKLSRLPLKERLH